MIRNNVWEIFVGFVSIGLISFWFGVMAEREAKIMDIEYCFKELADGSLYHYVCEKE